MFATFSGIIKSLALAVFQFLLNCTNASFSHVLFSSPGCITVFLMLCVLIRFHKIV